MRHSDYEPGSSLEGRRVLVAGASAGIGRATAVLAAAQGALVACMGRRRDAVDEVAKEIDGVPIVADLTDEAQVTQAVSDAIDGLGGLDGLVNSAGTVREGGLASTRVSDWRTMFETNVLGLLLITQTALPALKAAAPADIVNISSMGGRRVHKVESGVYSGTKFAVHAISEAMRRELFEDRIRVAVIAPGSVNTRFGSDLADEEQMARATERRAAMGLASEDVARQVVNAMAQPPDVTLQEIAMTSMRQLPG